MAILLLSVSSLIAQTPRFFQSPYTLDQMKGKQAVVETSMGTIVFQLLPDVAPNHVGHFMKLAADGSYAGTTIHRVIKYGIIQGGDPLSKDPAKSALYGTGGLGELKAEINGEKHTAGAVSAVLRPGQRDSAGAQFFICASDQSTLDGQYTVFGRVVEGLDIVQQISAVPADAEGHPATRIVITSVTIRNTPPPPVDPFAQAAAADLAKYHAVLDTTKGKVELDFLPDKAPETVRQFLRLASAGVFDGVGVHRVVPNFVIQTGALAYRAPLTPAQQKLVHNLKAEFNDTIHVPGTVSMAHGEDPDSATTSFFICIGECRGLDGKYTAFARVINGMDVVKAIAESPVDGEAPREKITVTKVTLQRSQL